MSRTHRPLGAQSSRHGHATGQSITQSEIYGDNVYCTTKVNKCTKQIDEALKELGVDVKAGQEPDKEIAAQVVDKSKNAIRMAWGLQLGGDCDRRGKGLIRLQ